RTDNNTWAQFGAPHDVLIFPDNREPCERRHHIHALFPRFLAYVGKQHFPRVKRYAFFCFHRNNGKASPEARGKTSKCLMNTRITGSGSSRAASSSRT